MDVETATQHLAYLAALKKLLGDEEARCKAVLVDAGKRRTEYPIDDEGSDLAAVTVKDIGSASVSIDSVEEVMPWAMDEFGPDVIETVTRLSEQGRASVIAAAKAGAQIPGVTVTPAVRKLSVSVTAKPGLVQMVQGMASRGALVWSDLLAVEAK